MDGQGIERRASSVCKGLRSPLAERHNLFLIRVIREIRGESTSGFRFNSRLLFWLSKQPTQTDAKQCADERSDTQQYSTQESFLTEIPPHV